MNTRFVLNFEAAGCATECAHCWARGGAYDPMAVDDVRRVLLSAKRVCERRDVPFIAGLMHDVTAHPQAVDLMALFGEVFGRHEFFQPLATNGVALARRGDCEAVLDAAHAAGTKMLWMAFHGLGATHDRHVNCDGAFDDALTTARRAQAMGLGVGANVFVSRANLDQLSELSKQLADAGVSPQSWEVARFTPHERGRRHEAQRPTLDELRPVAELAVRASDFRRDEWGALETLTEAAGVRKALDGEPVEWAWAAKARMNLVVCRPDLTLAAGVAHAYGRVFGDLRSEDPDAVFERALAAGPSREETHYFTGDGFPAARELAEAVGDATSRRIHFALPALRLLWLDRALPGRRKA